MANSLFDTLAIFMAVGIGLPLVSLAIEALRRSPSPPKQLRWAPDVPIQYVDVNNLRLRYIKSGNGPVLVLLHTLRTQLDLFEKVVPELAKKFTVYALDLPGHGYSDIPDAKYDATFFVDTVEAFLDVMDLRDVMLSGVSIGGAISLIIAGRNNQRVTRVVAINPYDYAGGHGMARSSILARWVVFSADIPVLGETVMRLRNFLIIKNILEGGVSDSRSISLPLLKEIYLTGNRKGHYQAFISLLRNSESWEIATKDYSRIKIPVLFLWGTQDWACPDERDQDRQKVPSAQMVTVEDGGHFLVLDRPQEVIQQLGHFYLQNAI